MQEKVILVTGGAGYIGSHACKALARAGYLPVVYDNLIHGHAWAVKWGPLEIGDLLDRLKLDHVIQKYQPIAIMHFAAYAYVGESVKNPGKYYQNNVSGTLSLIEAARDNSIDKIIFSSTCATYGVPNEVPIRESHLQNPINPYGSSKLMIERILQDFDLAHGIRSISLRYFNAAGADPEAEIGEAHYPETHLIPLVLDVAYGQHPIIKIFGNDYETPDGTCIRDYIHVSDLANAHILALQALENGAITKVYNLGNGQGYSVNEVISMVSKVTKKYIHTEFSSRRSGDPACLVGDATKAKIELLWQPKYDKLQSIIETAWEWHKKYKYILASRL